MVGIYKITSPFNISYIGQSFNILKRKTRHKDFKNSKLKDLSDSFLLYGFGNHNFEVLYELPNDVSQSVLDEYESFYINQFREGGMPLFNIKDGGSRRGKHAASTLVKLSEAAKGREGFWKGKKRRKANGISFGKSGEECASSKLTKAEVCGIKQLLREGKSQRKIAKQFGVVQSTMGAINKGKIWKDA